MSVANNVLLFVRIACLPVSLGGRSPNFFAFFGGEAKNLGEIAAGTFKNHITTHDLVAFGIAPGTLIVLPLPPQNPKIAAGIGNISINSTVLHE